MKAITIKETGDFKQLTVDNIAIPEPSDNEVLVKIHYQELLSHHYFLKEKLIQIQE